MISSNETTQTVTDPSIPPQNCDSNVKTTSTPPVSVSMDNVQRAREDKSDHIAGYIFMCNSKTKPDCFIYRVFGLPASRMAVVEKIMPNTKLFLFDFDVKLLYGVYVADSSGKLAIEPHAFQGRFPAQVKFSIAGDCLPLPEEAFKEAIRENYSGGSKFKQILSAEQVNKLVSLFRPITILSPPRLSSVDHGAAESLHPPHRGSTFQLSNLCSHGQHFTGSDHNNVQLCPRSSCVQEARFPPLHLPHNKVAVARTHTLPFRLQHSFSRAAETYHPDRPGLYQHNTHTRYGTAVPQITSADSCHAPNLMPQSHVSPPQSVAPSPTMTAGQWVAMASEAQTSGNHNLNTAMPSSNEHQLLYNEHYGRSQVLPSLGGVGVESTHVYCNSTSSAASASDFHYQGYQTYHQVHSIATVQVASDATAHVSEAQVTYMTNIHPGYLHQEHPISQLRVQGLSADLRAGYAPTYYS